MKLNQRSMENAALYYLQRFATTRMCLRRVLEGKIRRVRDASPEQVAAARAWIDPLLDRYTSAGLIDDTAFAEQRASSLRRRGGSARGIAAKLAQKSVAKHTIAAAIEKSGDELEAACVLCRKKRLGRDPDRHRRDMAVLARAGFRYDVIVAALKAGASLA